MKKILISLLLLAASTLSAANLEYNLLVDTSAYNGLGGQLSFQFNPAGTDPATATISQFSGATLGSFSVLGDVSGDLSSTVVIGLGDSLNEFLQNLTFSNSFQFTLSFAGLLFENPQDLDGSSFGLFLLPDDGDGVLLVQLDFFPGFETLEYFDESVTLREGGEIPEPGTAWLLLLGAPAIWLHRRR